MESALRHEPKLLCKLCDIRIYRLKLIGDLCCRSVYPKLVTLNPIGNSEGYPCQAARNYHRYCVMNTYQKLTMKSELIKENLELCMTYLKKSTTGNFEIRNSSAEILSQTLFNFVSTLRDCRKWQCH